MFLYEANPARPEPFSVEKGKRRQEEAEEETVAYCFS